MRKDTLYRSGNKKIPFPYITPRYIVRRVYAEFSIVTMREKFYLSIFD